MTFVQEARGEYVRLVALNSKLIVGRSCIHEFNHSKRTACSVFTHTELYTELYTEHRIANCP